jgi:hypothetical protein
MTTHFRTLAAAAALLGALAAPFTAHAGVVTFEPDDFVLVLTDGETHSVEGFNFKLQSGRADSSFYISGQQDGAYVNNGSKNLYSANQANVLVTSETGLSFDLFSFELGGSFVDLPDAWAESLTIIGHGDAGDVMTTVALPSTATLTTISLNWFGLKSFELRPNGNPNVDAFGPDFAIDNIRVGVIPEPGSAALVLAGLAAFLGRSKRASRNIGSV